MLQLHGAVPSPYMSWSPSSLTYACTCAFSVSFPAFPSIPALVIHAVTPLPCSSSQEDKKVPPPLPKKPIGGVTGSLRADSTAEAGGMLVVSRGRSVPEREKSLDVGERQKLETRRRLLQTKRSASFRQNSATESADSIEIYITEAQTRLWISQIPPDPRKQPLWLFSGPLHKCSESECNHSL